jgi:hypothetical protein
MHYCVSFKLLPNNPDIQRLIKGVMLGRGKISGFHPEIFLLLSTAPIKVAVKLVRRSRVGSKEILNILYI